jgi:hypothetical protein
MHMPSCPLASRRSWSEGGGSIQGGRVTAQLNRPYQFSASVAQIATNADMTTATAVNSPITWTDAHHRLRVTHFRSSQIKNRATGFLRNDAKL